MKCLIIECEKEATKGWETCCKEHSSILNFARKHILLASDADEEKRAMRAFMDISARRNLTIEECLTY